MNIKVLKKNLKKLLVNLWWFISYFKGPSYKNNIYDLTIGITTFLDRFELYFKDLLEKVSFLFPEVQILVIVNGHVNLAKQKEYIKEISDFVKKFNNVTLISFLEPKGLSFLWNLILKNAKTDKVLILNDDLNLYPSFRKDLIKSGILQEEIATINSIWSHFIISKYIFEKIGPFDEGLIEIGGEDDDYLARLAIEKIYPKNFKIKSIINSSHKLKFNSYGKDMTCMSTHSEINTKYLYTKWIVKEKYFDGSVYSRGLYWRLRKKNNEHN